jgi:HlyD family secretion protein
MGDRSTDKLCVCALTGRQGCWRLAVALCTAALWPTFAGLLTAAEVPGEYAVRLLPVEVTVRQRGILESVDTSPAVVRAHGRILEIVAQGTPIKKGEKVFEIESSEARNAVEQRESTRDRAKLDLEILQARYRLVEYQETEQLQVSQAELEHARLEEQEDLGKPAAEDLRLLAIEKEQAELDVQDTTEECQQQRRLYERNFISLTLLQSFERRAENASAQLQEVERKIALRRKGVTEERRIELRRAVERAEAAVARAEKQKERKLAEIRAQSLAAEARIDAEQHALAKSAKEIAQAVTVAERDGTVKVRQYFDWRSGGRLRDRVAGDEVDQQDIIADVINPEKMLVKLVVNEADFHVLRQGMPVRVTLPALPAKLFLGKVEQLGAIGRDRNLIDPTARSGGRSGITMFNAEISFAGDGTVFQPGMSAMVEIVVAERRERLVVPRAAVVSAADGSFAAYRKAGPQASRVALKGQLLNEEYFHVEQGLSAGDILLLRPPREL